jgi:rhodanese-related sulfurtransferase
MKYGILLIASLSFPLVACDKPAEQPADEKTEKTTDDKTTEKKDAHDAFTDLSPDEMQKLVAAKDCVPVDANGAKTRDKYGVVPGAVLLSGADFKTSELPEDKSSKLVFYCGGQACMAAPKAAKLAQDAGYKDVNVMRSGIRGYVDAGKTVDKPKS